MAKKFDPKVIMQEVIAMSEHGIAPSTQHIGTRYHKLVAEFGSWPAACEEMGLRQLAKSKKRRNLKRNVARKGDLIRALFGVSTANEIADTARGWPQGISHEEGARRMGIK